MKIFGYTFIFGIIGAIYSFINSLLHVGIFCTILSTISAIGLWFAYYPKFKKR